MHSCHFLIAPLGQSEKPRPEPHVAVGVSLAESSHSFSLDLAGMLCPGPSVRNMATSSIGNRRYFADLS